MMHVSFWESLVRDSSTEIDVLPPGLTLSANTVCFVSHGWGKDPWDQIWINRTKHDVFSVIAI
jgi:hypothetical protein